MSNEEFKAKLEQSLKDCKSREEKERLERAIRIVSIGGIEARRLRRDWERRVAKKQPRGMEYKEAKV